MAWCTLVMLGDSYACGAAAVAQSLRDVNTKYPIWCAVAGVSDGCKAFLEKIFDRVVEVPLIQHAVAPMKSAKQREIYGGWIHASFTKWNVLNPELFPVEKIILLDADMLFLQNCDELFDLQAPALTFSSPWAWPYMRRGGAFNPYSRPEHGAVIDHEDILKGLGRGILGLACMVLLEPNADTYATMMNILTCMPEYGNRSCISGFDEQLIAETIISAGLEVRHIHQKYNWIVGKNNWLPEGGARTQQYYNEKPWNDDPAVTQWDDVRQWHEVYQRVIDNHPEAARLLAEKTLGSA